MISLVTIHFNWFAASWSQVDVGDFLRLKSCVLYTELDNPTRPLINIEVVAHVTRPELRSSEVSTPERQRYNTLSTNFELAANFPRFGACSSNFEQVSNTFYFTFTTRPEAMKDGLKKIRNVVPATEEEARRVLQRMDAENPQLVQTSI